MLVVVKNRNPRSQFQVPLQGKTFGRGDILQDDPSETGGQPKADLNDFFGILGVKSSRQSIHPGKSLEKNRSALEHGQGRLRARTPDPVDRRTVADQRDRVPPAGQVERTNG